MKLPNNVVETLRSADQAGIDVTDRGAVLTFCSGTHEAAWLAELPLVEWVNVVSIVLQPTPGVEKPRGKKKVEVVEEVPVSDPFLPDEKEDIPIDRTGDPRFDKKVDSKPE